MKVWRLPVRVNTPVRVGPYLFEDGYGVAVDLADEGYTSVVLDVKRDGDAFDAGDANFVSAAAGTVDATYTFPDEGVWQVQFVASKPSGQILPGEPLQFRVVKNVRTLATNELLQY